MEKTTEKVLNLIVPDIAYVQSETMHHKAAMGVQEPTEWISPITHTTKAATIAILSRWELQSCLGNCPTRKDTGTPKA